MTARPLPNPVSVACGGLLALAAAMGIGRFLYTPLLPMMAADLGLGPTEAGLIAAANFAGYLGGALLVALPHLPGHRRSWLLVALVASAASTAAMGALDGFGAQLALRAAGGVASAFALVFGSALVTGHLAAAGRPGLMAVHFAGVGAGIVLSAVVAGAFAAAEAGWRGLWFAGGGATLAAAAGVAWLLPGGADAPPAPRGPSAPGLWRLVTAYGGLGFGYVITATFVVAIVREDGGSPLEEAAVWSAVGLAAMPSVWLWGRAARRIGEVTMFQIALLIEALAVALTVAWPGWAGLMTGAVGLGGTFVALTATGFTIARRLSGSDARAIIGVMTAAFGTGQMIGPAAAGWLREATGSYLAPSLMASAVLAGGALIMLPVRRGGAALTGSRRSPTSRP